MKTIKRLSLVAIMATSSMFATSTPDIKTDTSSVKELKKEFIANELNQDEIAALKAKFPKLLTQMEITRSKKYGAVTQFEVEARTPQGPVRFNSFVVDGQDYIFSGNAYDKDANILNLPFDIQKVKEAVAFKIGDGAKQLYLFTEPECPYCQRMEANLDPEKTKDYTINVLPMPLNMHKEAKPMLYWVLSAGTDKEKSERLTAVMAGDKTYKSFTVDNKDKAKFEELFSKVNKLASEVGAGGTPSMFGENMEKINYAILLKNP